ncbi:hypothetical protein Ctob_015523 [Chrysochromulina tobinii]|uniref:Uncharacterized protein n=1 Tax=Chrysochromulina tobinii TaxID=1460289 RepID=A0A0M0LPT5_9EUKA|nr:hypothetical protein Ctob_015523 [Chrysochromulina tobinii]|eukprot:KOO53039.1 hypothetical protein Ctob_015523 [Chrysochromulina sp. CCMP291]
MAGSVAQVEGLLRRLGELEETVMLQQVSDDRLKEANIALMERLSDGSTADGLSTVMRGGPRAQAVTSELELRSELLAQSRAAAGAVESENDDFRARVESLETDIAVLQQVLEEHRRAAAETTGSLRALEADRDESEAARDEMALELEEAKAAAASWREQFEQLRQMHRDQSQMHRDQTVAQEAALSTATRRVEQLTAEAAKRDQLLGAAQAALEQSGGRLSAATADRDDKLRAALEVSASLRSVIAQKEDLLQAAAARERRLGEIARKLESRALSSHAQLTQLREAEGERAAELQQLRGALKRAEAKAAALEEAVRLSP